MAAPPTSQVGAVAWARQNLFSSISNTLTTIVIIVGLAYLIPALIQWAVTDAVLTVKPSPESLSLIHISEPTRPPSTARMPASA